MSDKSENQRNGKSKSETRSSNKLTPEARRDPGVHPGHHSSCYSTMGIQEDWPVFLCKRLMLKHWPEGRVSDLIYVRDLLTYSPKTQASRCHLCTLPLLASRSQGSTGKELVHPSGWDPSSVAIVRGTTWSPDTGGQWGFLSWVPQHRNKRRKSS